ncbi:DUF2155 domain-containing protein [Celeribacter indicus]|uniref:DUF2155 domain-containing protein n=1 Tax=Celeribacter indicus TaxID=1208324 RepID=A0A0B5DXN1_9RHOB|nr:DUF2155 domain-containing protein [Celeribacter indicus]AJE47749.1 hypothetical protein P73_3034 [Celeribacter indicus]SDW21724.1 hypothetical protein SAMN05443573_10218 [Celeribacter indicus]
MSRLGIVLMAAFIACGGAQAQEPGFSDDLDTGIDDIEITPLEEDEEGGFGEGLSLEELQRLPDEGFQDELNDITTEFRDTVASSSGATLRALDKLTGRVEDLGAGVGDMVRFGRIEIFLGDCRYPEGNPSGDAYAYLTVRVDGTEDPVFSGWMIASSPALNAMDHQRYDLWPLSCSTS